jgi:hypothetical protein
VVLESYSKVMEGNRYVEYQTLRGGSAGFALDCLIGTLEICRLANHSFGSKLMYLPIGRG